ncbi:acyltransferase [Nissabacter sp. SGAir0207]|uniref:acyltransferase family protein n=1 Tax=Nissabacter sp. SGAir0207 TaxID=2126321 RepID=UPI00143DBBE1|nr:acyltransferase [Nissabacter sp. SGAir0207]
MTGKIDTLQYLRAFAALLVVFNHTWQQGAISTSLGLAHMGGFGVDIFFVISGFIMSYTLKETFASPKKAAIDFIIKRIIRIYPVYLILLTPFVLKYLASAPDLFAALTSYHLLGNLLLLPTFTGSPTYGPLLGVAWTLVYEMFFYLIYAAAILLSRRRVQAILLACAIILVMVLSVNLLELRGERLGWTNFQFMVGDPLMLDFLLGSLCFFIVQANLRLRLNIGVAALGALALTLLTTQLTNHGLPRLVIYGLPAFMVVLLLIQATDLPPSRLKHTLMLLGDASYSIYLIHINFAIISNMLSDKSALNDDLIGIALSLCAVVCGILFHLKLEKPLIKKISTRYRGQPMALAGETLAK